MKTHFFNYLRFTRAERNGTIALLLLATLIFAIPEITRFKRPQTPTDFRPFQTEIQAFKTALKSEGAPAPFAGETLFDFDPNTASFEDFIHLGLSKKVAGTICKYREKGGKFREPADFQKIWSLDKQDYERLLPYLHIPSMAETPIKNELSPAVAEGFPFDPNTASEAELFRLGLPNRTVQSILHYRDKGGQFRKKEDLEKIYTLNAEDYARIAPFATFLGAASTASSSPAVAYAGFGTQAKKTGEIGPVDINTAGVDVWRTLPGIGEIRARQLVSYREKLGGFVSVDQVAEMRGLPDSIFQNIKTHLVWNAGALNKINLNEASMEELDAHPYISRRQAELIVAYREQHGAFASPDDIGKMRAIADPVWLARIKPYLGTN